MTKIELKIENNTPLQKVLVNNREAQEQLLALLIEFKKENFNFGLQTAIAALPEIDDGRVEIPDDCYKDGVLVIDKKSLPYAVKNLLVDHQSINTKTHYREEAITNINNKRI